MSRIRKASRRVRREGAAVKLGLLAAGLAPRVEVGIEVEHDEVGIVEDRALERRLRAGEATAPDRRVGTRRHPREPGVQLEPGHLAQPEQGREVLADEILAVALVLGRVDLTVRANAGAGSQCFWKKLLPVTPSGKRVTNSGRSARCGRMCDPIRA